MKIREIITALEIIAPSHLRLENDPTGLLVGDPEAATERVMVALDVTAPIVKAAREKGAGLIIAHHPLIFHPLKAIRADEPHPGAVIMECIRRGIAVACAHTCWDVAPGGVNDVLANLLGLENIVPLRITHREPLVKIAVFTPTEFHYVVMEAMANAGAGAVGASNYDRCAFWTPGTGTFRPLPGAKPFVGTVGEPEQAMEERLEMIAPEGNWPAVVAAMKIAHPYEEVAYDVYPLKNAAAEYGIGRVGDLPEPLVASAFLERVKTVLSFPEVRNVGPKERIVRRVAVCGGAGAEFLRDALAAGADAFITSDVRHHEFVDAAARNFLLVDAGHAATETPGSAELARRLAAALPAVSTTFHLPDGAIASL